MFIGTVVPGGRVRGRFGVVTTVTTVTAVCGMASLPGLRGRCSGRRIAVPGLGRGGRRVVVRTGTHAEHTGREGQVERGEEQAAEAERAAVREHG